MFVPFLRFSTDATMLAIEAQTVISARLTQFALGQGTGAETNLMVSEKILALAEAVFTVAAGGSVHEVVRGYRKHVRVRLETHGWVVRRSMLPPMATRIIASDTSMRAS
jgi:hypothetical protein